MVSSPVTRRSKTPRRHRVGLAGLFLVLLPSVLTTNCDNAQCEELRDELFSLKLEWQKCEVSEDCMIVAGNTGDCTGIMACNFALNRTHRLEASRRVASLPEESVDCHQCNAPNCDRGEFVVCEAVSQLCVIVEEDFPGAVESVVYATPNDPPPKQKADASVDAAGDAAEDADSGSATIAPEQTF